jgi:hypothetical protein
MQAALLSPHLLAASHPNPDPETAIYWISFTLVWHCSTQVFNVFPTALEISLVGGILTYNFGPAFGVLTLGTIGTYTAFTFATTQWRIQFRRQVRETCSVFQPSHCTFVGFHCVSHHLSTPTGLWVVEKPSMDGRVCFKVSALLCGRFEYDCSRTC